MSSRPRRRRPSSTPGPKGEAADVRGALLAAGHELYRERGFDRISLRDVADRAGVNQAMVRYYFKDRHGFLAAMLDEGWGRLFDSVPAGGTATDVFAGLMSSLNAMPWLPVLMMQCVYTSDELRGHFVETHVPRMIAMLRGAVEARLGLDPRFAVLSIISMLVFPHLARPVVGPVFGLRYDERFARDFADHIATLFGSKGTSRE